MIGKLPKEPREGEFREPNPKFLAGVGDLMKISFLFFFFRDDLDWYFSILKHMLIFRYSDTMKNQVAQTIKNLPANSGDTGDSSLIPGSWRSLVVGNGNPFQYSCLEKPMGRGAWWLEFTSQRVRHDWTHNTSNKLRGVTFSLGITFSHLGSKERQQQALHTNRWWWRWWGWWW